MLHVIHGDNQWTEGNEDEHACRQGSDYPACGSFRPRAFVRLVRLVLVVAIRQQHLSFLRGQQQFYD